MRLKVFLTNGEDHDQSGHSVQLDLLAKIFVGDPLVSFERGDYVLQSSRIDEADEKLDSTFYDFVGQVVQGIDSVATFLIPGYRPGVLMIDRCEGGRERGVRLRIHSITLSGVLAVLPALSASNANALLGLMDADSNLSRALYLLDRHDSMTVWYDLWGVRDIIKFDLANEAWIKARWTAEQCNRFRVSANQRMHSGDLARHQDSNGDARIERVSSNEAREWLRALLLDYVSERLNVKVTRAG